MANSNLDQLTFTFYKVLPLVYDEALSYDEVVYACVNKINEMIEAGFNDYTGKISEINAELDKLTNDITVEITTRKNQDNAIAGNDTGTVPTKLDDVSASSLLGQEKTARKKADDNLQSQINQLENASVSAYVGHNYILIGDGLMSGVDGSNSTSTATGGWGDLFKANLGSNFKAYYSGTPTGLVNSTADLRNAGFTSSANSYLQQLQAAYAYIGEEKDSEGALIGDVNGITDIVILGGYNDANATEDDINAAIEALMTYATTNFPKAYVYCGVLGTQGFDSNSATNYYKNIENYGGIYIPDSKNLYSLSAYIGTDGKHLTGGGYEYYKLYTNQLVRNKHADYELGGLALLANTPGAFADGIGAAFYEYTTPRGYKTVTTCYNYYDSAESDQISPIASTGYSSSGVADVYFGQSISSGQLTNRPGTHILWEGLDGLTQSGTTKSRQYKITNGTISSTYTNLISNTYTGWTGGVWAGQTQVTEA